MSEKTIDVQENSKAGPAQQVFEWGCLEDKQLEISQLGGSGGVLPRKMLILTPLKCREMHLKLINEILKYKLSGLKKRYFYPIETDKHFLSSIIKFTIIH